MRLPDAAHTSQPWRIHQIARDFTLEDVWELPTPGGAEDFAVLVRLFTTADRSDHKLSLVARALFAIRWRIGKVFGWDEPGAGLNQRVLSLRDRLPVELRETGGGPDTATKPFSAVYQTDTEWVAEIANKTVHGLMHIGWVGDNAAGYRAQMAVLVKPNGRLGKLYLAAIRPFRYAFVYPSLTRTVGRRWQKARIDDRRAG
jgi:hypothetical protein